ncbi:MAG: c-type cytochrome biosis protein CcsB [Microbacterium sp.]|nr:c-type cytochrome biosis protein CcsB [Microbacterium sp.]
MTDQLSLDDVSLLLVWTAIALYALAFIAYAIDLARRSAQAIDAQDATSQGAAVRQRELVGAGGETIAQVRASEEAAAASLGARGRDRARPLWARIGTAMTWLGFLFHLGATVTRGIEAERVPWSNMYEFAMTGTLLIVAVYLGVLFRYDLRFLGSFITGLVAVLMGGATLFHVDVSPLADPLKSIWLVIHVFVASLATALFALAFALSVLQLLQARRERKAVCPVRSTSSRSRTASRSSASSSGRSPSSPARSGPTTPGAATGASTPKRSGPS